MWPGGKTRAAPGEQAEAETPQKDREAARKRATKGSKAIETNGEGTTARSAEAGHEAEKNTSTKSQENKGRRHGPRLYLHTN